MGHKITFFLLTFLAFLFVFPHVSHAQVQNLTGLRFSCLQATKCRDSNACAAPSVHRALLTPNADTKAVPNDINTYLTECLEVDTDHNNIPETICTTADSTLDKELFCGNASSTDPQCDHYQILKDTTGYSIDKKSDYGIYFYVNGQLVKQPKPTKIASDGLGNIIPPKIEWQSATDKPIVRRYMIWNRFTVQLTESAGIGGQQQADLNFASQSSTCNGVSWDPYGRLFDAKTLEPIPDGSVTLKQLDTTTNTFDEAYANKQNANIVNPFKTGADGMFSFFVVDGQYSLTPQHANYTHMTGTAATLEQAMPNVNKIYSEYYFVGADPITQKGGIQHRDIPMTPNNGTGYQYDLALLDEAYQLQNDGTTKYAGIVNHPFAKLSVATCNMNTGSEVCAAPQEFTVQNGGPDKNGKFSISLDNKTLKAGEYFKPTFKPTDLTAGTLSQKFLFNTVIGFLTSLVQPGIVHAAETGSSLSTTLQPIVSYIEGYAYDAQGNLMPNAQVGIYVSFSEQPLYQVTTNARGYYKITSEYLPKTSYMIRYTSPTAPYIQTLLTTSQFMTQNSAFINAEKVNPYLITTAATDPRKNITPTFIPSQKTTPIPNVTQITQAPKQAPNTSITSTQAQQAQSGNSSLLIIGVLLIIIAIGGGYIAYTMMKKNAQTV